MTEQDPKLVELPVRLSTSKLWTIQENYFASKGIEAWKEEVPYYVTSNAFVGQRYALLVLNYIQDVLKKNPQNTEPFYILETGGGTGKFSFYFLQAFKRLLAHHHLENQKFCYVISDLIKENIEFCEQNASFAPYLQNKELDFTIFDVAKDQDFYLKIQNKRYSQLLINNPLIIIANYTIDCIKQDAFLFKENTVFELQLAIKSRYKNFDVNRSLYLNDLKLKYETKEIDIANYYDKDLLNLMLKNYQETFKDFKEDSVKVLIPLGGIAFMDNMHALTKGNYFMVTGDKGLTLLEQMPLVGFPNVVTFDGCFSFLVNFHAMSEYCKALGGDSLLTEHNNDFKLALYSVGTSFSQLPNTQAFFNTALENMGPSEFCSLFSEFEASSYRFAIPALLAFLRLSEWDPDAYSIIHDRLLVLISSESMLVKTEVESDLAKIRNNIYNMHFGEDFNNLLGIYYQTVKNDALAIACYEKSISLFKDKCASHFNMAVLYEKQKNREKAIYHYRKSYEIDHKNKKALTKARQLEGKTTTVILIPLLKSLLVVGLMALGIYLLR